MFVSFCQQSARLLITALLAVASMLQAAFAADNWQAVYSENGIRVETRKIEGSEVDAFKVTSVLNAPVETVLAVLNDSAAFPQWVEGISTTKLIDSKGFLNNTIYEISSMPWPVKNRDIIVGTEFVEVNPTRFVIQLNNLPQAVAKTDSMVRIKYSQGHYVVDALPDGRTLLSWQQHTDPAGALPGWLVNQLLLDIPIKTIQGLHRMVTRSEYQNLSFNRDTIGHVVGLIKSGDPDRVARANPLLPAPKPDLVSHPEG